MREATDIEEAEIDRAKAILSKVGLYITGLKDDNGAVLPKKGL